MRRRALIPNREAKTVSNKMPAIQSTTWPGPLLMAGEPPALEVVNGDSSATVVLTCDHASNRLPRRLGNLGLAQRDLDSHIGWDVGAAGVARALSRALSAPLVLSSYSRLVIDCNRPPESPGSIPLSSAGVAIPGNRDLDDEARRVRRETFFTPYHNGITELLDRRAAIRQPTALLAIHSFTPDYPGEERPWHIDIAYSRDRRLAALLLDKINEVPGLLVGDNLPYGVDDESDYTIPFHGERRGLPHVLIEIRQDLLATIAGIEWWIDRLLDLIRQSGSAIERLATEAVKGKD